MRYNVYMHSGEEVRVGDASREELLSALHEQYPDHEWVVGDPDEAGCFVIHSHVHSEPFIHVQLFPEDVGEVPPEWDSNLKLPPLPFTVDISRLVPNGKPISFRSSQEAVSYLNMAFPDYRWRMSGDSTRCITLAIGESPSEGTTSLVVYDSRYILPEAKWVDDNSPPSGKPVSSIEEATDELFRGGGKVAIPIELIWPDLGKPSRSDW